MSQERKLALLPADTEHVNQRGFEDLLCELYVCVSVCWTGLSDSCFDELALGYLFPLPLLHNYVRLVCACAQTYTHVTDEMTAGD